MQTGAIGQLLLRYSSSLSFFSYPNAEAPEIDFAHAAIVLC